MQMLVCLMLSQKRLKLSEFLFIDSVISTTLSFSLLIHSSVLSNLLLIPSSIFSFQLLYS